MSSLLALVLQASSNLWNPFITEGSHIEFNPLSHTHRNSPECMGGERRMQNEPNIGIGASSIHPTSKPPHYQGPQH